MARNIQIFSEDGPDALVTAFNDFFAALLNTRIIGIEILSGDKVFMPGAEMTLVVVYEDDGETMTTPWVLQAVEGGSAGAVDTAVQAILTGLTTEFYAITLANYTSQRRSTEPYSALVLTNEDAAGNANLNWMVSVTAAVPFVTSIVVGDSPYTAVGGETVLANDAGGAIVVNIDPTTLGADEVCVKKTGAVANVTITPTSGTIDGGANLPLTTQYDAAIVTSDGTNLFVKAALGLG